MNQVQKRTMGVVAGFVVAGLIGVGVWLLVRAIKAKQTAAQKNKGTQGTPPPPVQQSNGMPFVTPGGVIAGLEDGSIPTTSKAFMQSSNASGGYASEDSAMYGSCVNQNLIGAAQVGTSQKLGASSGMYHSAPMGSEPRQLNTARLSARGARIGKKSRVDFAKYATMGADRAMGVQGLDLPQELALASTQLGHLEVSENTRHDSQHPWGDPQSAWRVGYSVDSSGNLQPGDGGIIPQHGPYALAQRVRGGNF